MRHTLTSFAAITSLFSLFIFKTPNTLLIVISSSVAIITGIWSHQLAKKEAKPEKASLLFALIGVLILGYRLLQLL